MQTRLINACKKNERRAQLKIYKQYAKAMYNVSYNMVHNATEAEDLMQEAFISAFHKISTYKGEVTFGAWLKRITINKCLDFLKKKKLYFDDIENHKDIPIDMGNQSDEEFLDYSVQKIKDTIQKLSTGYRTILSLYLLEGYDHAEIAEILDITSSTSRSQYTRAKVVLLKKLKEDSQWTS